MKFAKVIFSEVSVCPQEGPLSLSRGVSIQGGLCPGEGSLFRRFSVKGSLSREVSVWGESLSGGRGSLSGGISVHGGLCPDGSCPRGLWGVSVQGRFSVEGGLCPGGLCPGGLCPGGLCPGVSEGSLSTAGSLSRGSLSRGLYPGRSLSWKPPYGNEWVVRITLECILVCTVRLLRYTYSAETTHTFPLPWHTDKGFPIIAAVLLRKFICSSLQWSGSSQQHNNYEAFHLCSSTGWG